MAFDIFKGMSTTKKAIVVIVVLLILALLFGKTLGLPFGLF
jgi:hypothetical protein